MTEAERITRALRGRWHGRYGTCLCPGHQNTRTPALSLSDGEDGRLLIRCHAGCTFEAVLGALQALGLVDGRGSYTPPSAEDLARIEAARKAEAAKKEAQALSVWREAVPIEGTPAEAYLRWRGISAPLGASLRFHGFCWHGPTAKRLPAMVALIEGAGRAAVHRTYLAPDGHGRADVPEGTAKMMLGAAAGGAVRVADAQSSLVVAEGIETALSLASGLLRAPAAIWAALSTSGMQRLNLPDHPGRLTIATDGDDPGQAAGKALAVRAAALGWSVSMLPAPLGRDWNDVIRSKGATP
ncbi:DUF7146 domain-containing protein [Frigidibacter sp. MR17.24]|uniref:DUF7146 domain-containing protein n=1 Tax=Frigidibacter sp. MR17.24 TaxID=3127345 RepID=UPI003012F171